MASSTSEVAEDMVRWARESRHRRADRRRRRRAAHRAAACEPTSRWRSRARFSAPRRCRSSAASSRLPSSIGRGFACARTACVGDPRRAGRRARLCSTATTSSSSTRSGSPRRPRSQVAGSRSSRRRCSRWHFGRVEPSAPTTGRHSRPSSRIAPQYSLPSFVRRWPCRSGRRASRSAPSSSSSTARMPSTTSWSRSPSTAAGLAEQALERARLYERERETSRALERILQVAPRFYAGTTARGDRGHLSRGAGDVRRRLRRAVADRDGDDWSCCNSDPQRDGVAAGAARAARRLPGPRGCGRRGWASRSSRTSRARRATSASSAYASSASARRFGRRSSSAAERSSCSSCRGRR